MTTRLAAAKDASPRWIKDVANTVTRRYGLATAARRPLPDFLIVGTKRGGTTSLWNNLMHHPQVLGMFPQSRGRKSSDWFFTERTDMDWYRSHFPTERARERAAGGLPVVTGEASPYYMYGPHIPQRIAAVMPRVRLIVLLRDPVERAFSHYQERVKEGVEPLSFEDALAAESVRVPRDPASVPGYCREHDFYSYRDRGVYLPQVERLQRHFPAEQVYVARSEDFYEDYQAAFDAVTGFLGLRPHHLGTIEHHNKIPRAPMAAATRAELTAFYRPHNEALEQHLRRSFHWSE